VLPKVFFRAPVANVGLNLFSHSNSAACCGTSGQLDCRVTATEQGEDARVYVSVVLVATAVRTVPGNAVFYFLSTKESSGLENGDI